MQTGLRRGLCRTSNKQRTRLVKVDTASALILPSTHHRCGCKVARALPVVGRPTFTKAVGLEIHMLNLQKRDELTEVASEDKRGSRAQGHKPWRAVSQTRGPKGTQTVLSHGQFW